MSRFEAIDFYNIDAQLSDEERMVRDAVREWVSDQVIPVIEEHCRNGTFPKAVSYTHLTLPTICSV